MALSASIDSFRTCSSRKSVAASWRVRAIADKSTERNQGSLAFSSAVRRASNPSGEWVAEIAKAASAAASSPGSQMSWSRRQFPVCGRDAKNPAFGSGEASRSVQGVSD